MSNTKNEIRVYTWLMENWENYLYEGCISQNDIFNAIKEKFKKVIHDDDIEKLIETLFTRLNIEQPAITLMY